MQSKETKQLIERIFRFNKLMHDHMSQMSDCTAGGLKMLSVIDNEFKKQQEEGIDLPGVSVSRISQVLMHSKPATSKMLNALEERGEIERIYSKVDRRAVYIRVTEKGRERADELQGAIDQYTNQILEHLGKEKTEMLFDSMDSLYEAVKEVHEEEQNKKKEKNKGE